MKKEINHIAEELMLRYVEGNLSDQEKEDFENILAQNEYLRKRVSALKDIVDSQPLESPSLDTHNDILKRLNIDTTGSHDKIDTLGYFDKIVGQLIGRPILLASSMSCVVVAFMVLSFNNSSSVNETEINTPIVLEEKSQSDLERVFVDDDRSDEKDIDKD